MNRALPIDTLRPSTVPAHTLPGHRLEIGDVATGRCSARVHRRRSPAPEGCSLTLSRLAASCSSVVSSTRPCSARRSPARFAFGERAGLVDDQRGHLFEQFERLGVPEEHARLCAAAGAHHDRHRRGQAERARTRDDQDGDRIDERICEPGLRPHQRPRDKRHHRDGNDDRHEPGRNRIGQTLNRRARSLRLAHHPHDLREQACRRPRAPPSSRTRPSC